MDLYILDELYRRHTLIDNYESLVWTERFSDVGDFELIVIATLENRSRFRSGTKLGLSTSAYRVMTVETVENKTDDEGRRLLTITGFSLEHILKDRPNRRSNFNNGTVVVPEASVTGFPAEIVQLIFDNHCISNNVIPEDNLPNTSLLNFFPADTIPEPDESVTFVFPIESLFSTIKRICDTYSMGFRLVRRADMGELCFNIYMGSDRTTTADIQLEPVIFSPVLENLDDVTELNSTATLKTAAYVYSTNGSRLVFGNGYSSEVSGFERRVMLVDAMDIDLAAGSSLNAALEERGKEALASQSQFSALDGEVPEFSQYKYGIDYNLGDLVEVRNEYGTTSKMRVTEQIFASDAEGVRSYPTLSMDLFITPGSWAAWSFSQVWADAVGTWAEQEFD